VGTFQYLRMGDIATDTLIRRTDSQVSTAMEGETILLQLESGNYFSLNEVGALVWNELEAPRTVQQLCERVCAEYEVDVQLCLRDVTQLIEHLLKEQMVELG
jgi:hypothetical protein